MFAVETVQQGMGALGKELAARLELLEGVKAAYFEKAETYREIRKMTKRFLRQYFDSQIRRCNVNSTIKISDKNGEVLIFDNTGALMNQSSQQSLAQLSFYMALWFTDESPCRLYNNFGVSMDDDTLEHALGMFESHAFTLHPDLQCIFTTAWGRERLGRWRAAGGTVVQMGSGDGKGAKRHKRKRQPPARPIPSEDGAC